MVVRRGADEVEVLTTPFHLEDLTILEPVHQVMHLPFERVDVGGRHLENQHHRDLLSMRHLLAQQSQSAVRLWE